MSRKICTMTNANNTQSTANNNKTDWAAVGKGVAHGVVNGVALVAAATAGSLIAAAILAKIAKKD